jgi:hemerythrin
MALIQWSDEYSVQVAEIDQQHKKLVDLINELHQAMKEARGREVIGKILADLISYTKFHFSAEEKLMKNKNYPDFQNHKIEHENLTQKVLSFQEQYMDGKLSLPVEVIQFLKDWLLKHIKGSDKKYTPYLLEKVDL